MSHPAVEWTLDAIETNWPSGQWSDIPLTKIDRDYSQIVGGERTPSAELQDSNYVGVALADRGGDPIGTEFDLDLETAVSVRIEGLHADDWGFVDETASLPPGNSGDPVPWDPMVAAITEAIYTGRKFPDAGRANVDFTHLLITNETSVSSDYADYFRHDLDVSFDGFETLP